jgi:hypothetical protein
MAKKIVEYEINDNGNCQECGQCLVIYNCEDWEDRPTFNCIPFQEELDYRPSESRQSWVTEQCQACKDFLAQEASKVYCDGCTHSADYYRAHENGCGCELGYKTECSTNGWYSLNCKPKEQM